MVRVLQVGFRESPFIGAELLAELRTRGFQGIRTDCQRLGADATAARCQEIRDAGLIPLTIVYDDEDARLLPPGNYVEFRHETNINHGAGWIDRRAIPAQTYRGLLLAFHRASEDRGHVILASGVANEDQRGVAYLRDLDVQTWPADITLGWHFYPHGYSPTTPHPGFGSRDAAVAAMLRYIGKRPWAITECGFHTANLARWYQRPVRRTDTHVAEFAEWEQDFRRRMGATGLCWFQINDGPQNIAEHRYGLRRIDGTWKPVAEVWRDAA